MRMMILAGALAALTVPVLVGAEDRPPDAAKVRDTVGKLRKAAAAAESGDCKTATRILGPMLDAHDPSIPKELLSPTYHIAITCELSLDRSADAYRHALAGSALEDSDDALWRVRIAIELQDKRTEAAVVSVEAMSQGRGAALNALPVRWLYQLSRQLKDAGLAGPRRRLLTILSANAYSPSGEVPGTTDGFRADLAAILADAGDRPGAAALVADIGDPRTLIDIALDSRLVPLLPAAFDVRSAVERHLAEMQGFAALHPDRLYAVLQAAIDLRMLGRPQESLDILKALHGDESGGSAFKDADEYLVWWWDGIGRSHIRLGQYDAAVAAFRKGGETQEGGTLNVSQVINLADFQLDFAHPADALATIGVFDGNNRAASPFGMMQVYFARGCAQARLNRPAEAASALKYLQEHEKDAPGALTDMLLCTGDLDAAAASVVRRLADPDTRSDMLMQVSTFDPPVVTLPLNPLKVNMDKVVGRPEVQAAIQRAGGAQRIHLQRIEL
jgi:tetratricopeptide (TPR) repeat protein